MEAIETRASDDATTAPPTPQQSPPGDGAAGEDEVQAIVGSVDAAGGVIAINRISGADVQRILVDTRTTFRLPASADIAHE